MARFFRPTAFLFALLVIAGLLTSFVYLMRKKSVLHDRPIVVLILLLAAAFMVIRMFSTVIVFLFSIALPLASESYSIDFNCILRCYYKI